MRAALTDKKIAALTDKKIGRLVLPGKNNNDDSKSLKGKWILDEGELGVRDSAHEIFGTTGSQEIINKTRVPWRGWFILG